MLPSLFCSLLRTLVSGSFTCSRAVSLATSCTIAARTARSRGQQRLRVRERFVPRVVGRVCSSRAARRELPEYKANKEMPTEPVALGLRRSIEDMQTVFYCQRAERDHGGVSRAGSRARGSWPGLAWPGTALGHSLEIVLERESLEDVPGETVVE